MQAVEISDNCPSGAFALRLIRVMANLRTIYKHDLTVSVRMERRDADIQATSALIQANFPHTGDTTKRIIENRS
jgi:hypothetical protein